MEVTYERYQRRRNSPERRGPVTGNYPPPELLTSLVPSVPVDPVLSQHEQKIRGSIYQLETMLESSRRSMRNYRDTVTSGVIAEETDQAARTWRGNPSYALPRQYAPRNEYRQRVFNS
eukprot:TRINITY_DN5267_c0_g1_i1.p1 TRINITY_DN5267_c0_g1~~TRINITY_DN5267_c0_g1_i1.p1  ORF type:complete len:118 (-),score=7.56 TRINITY_DN5267_c0_g1_i1:233-586(-)